MLRFLADHNLHEGIVRGLRRRRPGLDLVLVRDLGLSGALDPDVLRWAADDRRIVLTHDRRTMPRHALDRLRSGEAMPGLFVVATPCSLAAVIEDLLTIVDVTELEEWEGKIEYLPYTR